jgi:hypothetical protein
MLRRGIDINKVAVEGPGDVKKMEFQGSSKSEGVVLEGFREGSISSLPISILRV